MVAKLPIWWSRFLLGMGNYIMTMSSKKRKKSMKITSFDVADLHTKSSIFYPKNIGIRYCYSRYLIHFTHVPKKHKNEYCYLQIHKKCLIINLQFVCVVIEMCYTNNIVSVVA
jgi:hypothetical protein